MTRPLVPFVNVLGEPYVTQSVVPTEPFALKYAIRDRTTTAGMQPEAIKQLQAAAAAARSAGLTELRVVAAKGGGHLSHFAGTEWDVVGYGPNGLWTPAQRVAVARGARSAGASRFGLYSFGKGSLGSGTLHFGYGPKGYARNVTWGAGGLTSGPLSRRYTDPDEVAFRDEIYGGKPPTLIADAGPKIPLPLAYVDDPTLTPTLSAVKNTAVRPVLRKGGGDQGWIRQLQQRLGAFAPLKIDGIFGKNTRNAVRAFQKQAGITVDGIVGPQTWNAIDRAYPIAAPAPAPVAPAPIIASMYEPGDTGLRPPTEVTADHLATWFKDGDNYVVAPTVSADGRSLSDDEAAAEARAGGGHYGKFSSAESAAAHAQTIHDLSLEYFDLSTLREPKPQAPLIPLISPYEGANSPFADPSVSKVFEPALTTRRLDQQSFDERFQGGDPRFGVFDEPAVPTDASTEKNRRLRRLWNDLTMKRLRERGIDINLRE